VYQINLILLKVSAILVISSRYTHLNYQPIYKFF